MTMKPQVGRQASLVRMQSRGGKSWIPDDIVKLPDQPRDWQLLGFL